MTVGHRLRHGIKVYLLYRSVMGWRRLPLSFFIFHLAMLCIAHILAYVLESLSCFFCVWQYGQHIIPIEVKAGTNSHLRSLHSFINNSQNTNIAVRVWSGEYFVQETKTPAPFNKPFRLINLPFYLVGSIDKIVEVEIKK